jgi:hypothetical protein
MRRKGGVMRLIILPHLRQLSFGIVRFAFLLSSGRFKVKPKYDLWNRMVEVNGSKSHVIQCTWRGKVVEIAKEWVTDASC